MEATLSDVHRPLLSHVHAFLKHREAHRASGEKAPASESFFLLRDDRETFWELIGFRMRGCRGTLLGAFRFRRQPNATNLFARRPLSYFLSQPPKSIGITQTARPAWLIEVLLPQPGEGVDAFRERVRDDRADRVAFLDANLLHFAFDFRLDNPSVEREREAQATAPGSHLVRTVRGHILQGTSHGLHTRLLKDLQFITFHNGRQYTPTGSFPLPTLSVNRSMVTMDAPIANNEDVATWLGASVPFDRSTAEARHILMPSDQA